MSEAAAKPPFLTRLADVVWNPIMVKELRAGTRGLRYFFTHIAVLLFAAFLLLCVLGLGIAASTRNSYSHTDPSTIGLAAFITIQVLQLVIVFLVVPAFTATAIVQERDQNTFDILMSSTLTPWQIAWGKLTAAMTQVGLIFVSLMPLVAMTFLFGGVSFRQVVVNYLFLGVLSVALSVWALSISSSVRSTARAVIGVYAGVVAFGILMMIVAAFLEDMRYFGAFMSAYGFIASPEIYSRRSSPLTDTQTLLYCYAIPLAAAGLWISFFLMHTANRLKPHFADKSRPYRFYYLGMLAILTILAFLCFLNDGAPASATERLGWMACIATGMAVFISMGCFFASEDPVLAPYIRAHYDNLPPRWSWLRWFGPGARRGDRFALLTAITVVGLIFALLIPFTHGFDKGAWQGGNPVVPLALGLGSILPWIYFLNGLGSLFAASLRNWPTLSKVLLIVIAFFLAVVPIVHWAITMSFTYRWDRRYEAGPFSLAFSPLAAVISPFMGEEARDAVPLHVDLGAAVPLHVLYLAIYGIAGSVLRIFAYRRIRALEAQMQ